MMIMEKVLNIKQPNYVLGGLLLPKLLTYNNKSSLKVCWWKFIKTFPGFPEGSSNTDRTYNTPQHHAGTTTSSSQHPSAQSFFFGHGSWLRFPAGLHTADERSQVRWRINISVSESVNLWMVKWLFLPAISGWKLNDYVRDCWVFKT